jgi:large repetitive protein
MTNSLKIRGVMVILCMLAVADGIAQGLSEHNWYFGNNTRAIRFNRTTNVAELVTKAPLTLGGSAVATDPATGNLYFYTNGISVFDRSHQIMPNGAGLTANASGNQPAAISPVPGTPTQYYVFSNSATTAAGGAIRVSIVDLSAQGNAPLPTPPTGAVLASPRNDATLLNLGNRSEAMLTIPHANGTDYWLITHERGTDNYTTTLITPTGFTPGPANDNRTGFSIIAGNFSYHAGTGKLAVTPQDANRNVVILTFDNTSGQLTFDQFVPNSAALVAQGLYDTEWSYDGNYLYISKLDDVLQFDLNNPTNSLASILPGSLSMVKSYGIQLAPDTAMYHLYEATAGVFRLGKLVGVDSVAGRGTYSSNAFPGNFNYNGRQFPSFATVLPITPTVIFTFKPDPTCANTAVQFFPTVTPTADSLVWNFNDGTPPLSQWSPVHTFANAGTYNVSVTPYLGGVAGTPFSLPVVVTSFTLQLSLVQDTTACSCALPIPSPVNKPELPEEADPNYCQPFNVTATASGGTASYQWYGPEGAIAGANGLTLYPQKAGYYWLVATVGNCRTSAGVNIREYGVIDQRANIWYFGNNSGLDFNIYDPDLPSPVAISNSVMQAPEGTATISDRNGQVLFFTDGETVWNRTFDVIATNIGGDKESAQSSIIIPVPGDETLYYIFTTQDIEQGRYELRYSLYDLKLNNGAGGFIEFNQLLYSPSTERMTSDGSWLVIHEYGNNSFRAYPITADGIGNPVISSIGSDHVFNPPVNGAGYMKIGNGELAVALSTGSGNFIEIFDFDNATGVISNFRSVNLNVSGQVYGIEFAGDKIFASVRNLPNSQIFEILDIAGAAPNIVQLPPISVVGEVGALQIGPNGAIYVAVNGAQRLGTILVNLDPTLASTYASNGSPQLSGTSTLGLPNFAQNIGTGPMQPGYLITGFCLGSPTDFTAAGTDPIDTFTWTITDSNGNLVLLSTNQTFSFTFGTIGTYSIELVIKNGCGYKETFTDEIEIVEPPNTPAAVPFCLGDPIPDLHAYAGPGTGYTYLWYNGATTESITVTRAGNYPVTITTPEGCVLDASVLAYDISTPLNLGSDEDFCSFQGITKILDGQYNAPHDWYLSTNGGPFIKLNHTDRQLSPLTPTTPGVYAYLDIFDNPFTPCISRDTITLTVYPSPDFDATAAQISCGANNGQIIVTVNSPNPATSSLSYTLTPPLDADITGIITSTPYAIPPTPTLSAGLYNLVVLDNISQCNRPAIVPINTNAFTITTFNQNSDCPDSPVTIFHDVSSFPYAYVIRNTVTFAEVERRDNVFDAGSFTTQNSLPEGTYIVEITSGGCSSSLDFSVTPNRPTVPPFNFDLTDICDGLVTANVSISGLQYSWTSDKNGIASGANTQTVTLTPGLGPQKLTVLVYDDPVTGSYCPTTNTIEVTFDGPIISDFTQSDKCSNEVTLTAEPSPSGTYNYVWRLNGTDVGYTGQLLVNQIGQFQYELVTISSGCDYSTTKTVDVVGPQTVAFTFERPCEASFDITATTSAAPSSQFRWYFNGSQFASTSAPTVTTTRGEGTYKVEVLITANNCFAKHEALIPTLPSPLATLPNRRIICNVEANPDPDTREVILNAGSGFLYSYQWYQNGDILVGETNREYVVAGPGTFSVEVTNEFECTITDQTLVEEYCIPRIEAPTAFRPGSTVTVLNRPDLSNSDFWVYGFYIDDGNFQIFIYNRWGEMVFQSNDVNFKWNGGYNNNPGQIMPAGTYTYVVRFKSKNGGGIHEQRGGVVLLR